MQAIPDIDNLPAAELEEWFLARAAEEQAAPAQMLSVLQRLAREDESTRAEACAELWQEELIRRNRADDLMRLLLLRCKWRQDRDYAGVCRRLLEEIFATDTFNRTLLGAAGFDQADLPADTALHRLQRLRAMQPGTACYDKTWGGGIIREINDYHRQVSVDFARKPGHRLALAHAAANLQLLSEDNILARHLRRPEAARAAIEENPDQAVREILRDFGPFSAIRLQEWVTTHLLPAEAWKNFWDGARKKLKQDPLVLLPARRNEPIVIHTRQPAHDHAWLEKFTQERELEKIFQGFEDIRATTGLPPEDPEMLALLRARLDFVLDAAGRREHLARARALLLAFEIGAAPDDQRLAAAADGLLEPEIFRTTLAALPVRCQAAFCGHLADLHPQKTAAVLTASLDTLDLNALNEVLRHMTARGQGDAAAARMRALLANDPPPMEIITWLCRNAEFRAQHRLIPGERLAFSVLNLLDNPALTGTGRTRCRNQLRDCLNDRAWIAEVCQSLNDQQARDFARRLKNAAIGSEGDNAAVLMHLISLRPELEGMLGDTTPADTVRLTSLRSYAERQAALHKLINEDIPNNSREIGIARSYGDLRENFEYKSAKDTQGILMRRRMELERMLAEVRATDFANASAERAGPGTSITLQHPDGARETFTILGEWDNDEVLGIIPSRSQLAEIIAGAAPGTQIEIPDADAAPRKVTVVEVAALPAEIRAWIHGGPATA